MLFLIKKHIFDKSIIIKNQYFNYMKKSVKELEKTLNANRVKKVIPVTVVKPEKVNNEPINNNPINADEICYGDCDTCSDEYCPAKCYEEDAQECPYTNACVVCTDDVCPLNKELAERTNEINSKADKIVKEKKNELKASLDLEKEPPVGETPVDPRTHDFDFVKEWNKMAQLSNDVDMKPFPELFPGAGDIVKKYNDYRNEVNAWMKKHKKFPESIAKACLLDEFPVKENSETENLSPNEKLFKSIVDKMFDTYKRKNKDYGSSFDELFDEYGMTSALLRIKDKYNRLKAINDNGQIEVKDESVEDTLLDMANYAILTVIKLRNNKTPNKSVEVSDGIIKFK